MNKIETSTKSKEYIEETFSRYTLIPVPDSFKFVIGLNKERHILHLYPIGDTMNDDNNDLMGYEDALLFDVHFYNVENKTKFVIKGRDQIVLNINRSCVRIFKDGSTMIIIDRPIKVEVYQSMEINEL